MRRTASTGSETPSTTAARHALAVSPGATTQRAVRNRGAGGDTAPASRSRSRRIARSVRSQSRTAEIEATA